MKSIMELKDKFSFWWYTLSSRERWLMMIFFVIIVLGIFYWGFYKPLENRAEEARLNMSIEKELHGWVVESANRISTARVGVQSTSNKQSLSQIVSNTASMLNVDLIRTQPKDNQLQVWVQPVPFETLVRWLVELRAKNVHVQILDVDRSGVSGVVEVKRLQFTKL